MDPFVLVKFVPQQGEFGAIAEDLGSSLIPDISNWVDGSLGGVGTADAGALTGDIFNAGTLDASTGSIGSDLITGGAPEAGNVLENIVTENIIGPEGTLGQTLENIPTAPDWATYDPAAELNRATVGVQTESPTLSVALGDVTNEGAGVVKAGESSSAIIDNLGGVNLEKVPVLTIPAEAEQISLEAVGAGGSGGVTKVVSTLGEGAASYGVSLAKAVTTPLVIGGGLILAAEAGAGWFLNKDTGQVGQNPLPSTKTSGTGPVQKTGTTDVCAALIAEGKMDSSLLAGCQQCIQSTGISGVDSASITSKQASSLVSCIEASGGKTGGTTPPTPGTTTTSGTGQKTQGGAAGGTIVDICTYSQQLGKDIGSLSVCQACEQSAGIAGVDHTAVTSAEISAMSICLQ